MGHRGPRRPVPALDCAKPGALDKIVDDPAKPLVTCSDDGLEKFILGPVEVRGDEIKDAVAGYQPPLNGQPSTTVEIALSFNGTGTKNFGNVTKRLCLARGAAQPLRRHPDSKVLTAPTARLPSSTAKPPSRAVSPSSARESPTS